ncbi:ImmA/IrrE family metallo-endopeptidase [Corynebacterium mastitidis]|uniref:ImmA/IrrE family metallo-endopeptidase n=1 Tax=Corynebacterium mastitidis TaxID=161890 RepID=A0A2N0X515_9CORY|nr:ImmA/IrrE family metallo-endopeptidase [Corynebacterium mastitidis]
MITSPDLHRIANRLGVNLRRHDYIDEDTPKGWYDHTRRVISTQRGLPIAEYRSTLAHELAHAHYGDTLTGNQVMDTRMEHRADRWAARLLLDRAEVEATLRWHDHHRAPAAHDLEVTEHLLDVWLELHAREIAA